jgi:hypothetical protein
VNPLLGWALAAALLGTSWYSYGWSGLALGFSVVAFWLLLQFNRAVRVMKNASGAPIGHVASALMFNAKLREGMKMIEILGLTKSLGEKVGESPERWRWRDAGGVTVTVELTGAGVTRWTLERPDDA